MKASSYKHWLTGFVATWLISVLCNLNVLAQTPNPVYTYFSPSSMYPVAGAQNWDFVRGVDGRLLVSNSNGILEYNGEDWKLILNSQSKGHFILWKSPQGQIYAASDQDLGMLKVGEDHELIFHSFLDSLENGEMPSNRIKWIFRNGETICFANQNEILQWLPGVKLFRTLSFEEEIVFATNLDRKGLVLTRENNTIKAIDLQQEVLWEKKGIRAREIIYFESLSDKEEESVLVTRKAGIFHLKTKEVVKLGAGLEAFRNLSVLDATRLNNGELALATEKYGVLILDKAGKFERQLLKNWGIPETGIISLFQDFEHNLWIGMDQGIMRLSYPGALEFYGADQGLKGVVSSILKVDGRMYIGTTEGLFYGRPGRQTGSWQFTQIEDVESEVWDLVEWRDQVIVASSRGVYMGKNRNFKRHYRVLARDLYVSEKFDKTLFVGLQDGLGYMEYVANLWLWRGKINIVDHRVKSIIEDAEQNLWVSNTTVSRLTLGENPEEVKDLKTFKEGAGLDQGMEEIQLSMIRDTLRFAHYNGLSYYDPASEQIRPDASYGNALTTGENFAYELELDPSGDLWMTQGQKRGRMVEDSLGNFEIEWKPLAYIPFDIWTIYADEEGDIWLGGSEGLFKHSPEKTLKPLKSFPAGFDLISNSEHTFFKGAFQDRFGFPAQNSDSVYSFQFPLWELNFDFNGLNLKNRNKIRYRYQLEGYDPNPSGWSEKSEKSYTGLREGSYLFWVEAQNIEGERGERAQYQFKILPPWYRSAWAYGIYGLLGLGLFGLSLMAVSRVSRRAMRKKEADLDRQLAHAKQLEHVNHLKDEYLFNTSYQITKPLEDIIGLSQALRVEEDNPQNKENLGLIISSSKQLSSLINDLIDFTKIKHNDIELHPKSINLRNLVEVVLRVNQPKVIHKQLQLVNEISAELEHAWADEQRVQQILFNLVGNSVKWTERGHVKVNAAIEKEMLWISVEDTGTGIPEEKRESLFKEFEQYEEIGRTEYTQSGLGLSISKKLVELMGGEMWLESAIDLGTTIFFTLPIAKGVAHPEVEVDMLEEFNDPTDFLYNEEKAAKMAGDKALAKILVVDDEWVNHRVYHSFLKNEPFSLHYAMDGHEALEMLEKATSPEEEYDLVLMDILMPSMSGYEVCQKIREKYLPAQLPVILMADKGQIHDLVEGFQVGANDYFMRPVTQEEFIARLKMHLNLQRINEATHRFVPDVFLRSLGRENITEVQLGDHIERRVTVLFADIRNYTRMAEQFELEENFKFLQTYASHMGPIIYKNRGFVHQYVGDGVLAIFEHSPEDAIRAAIEMQKEVEILHKEQHFEEVAVGIGLQSGNLMMGVIGDEQRFQVSTISDVVNTASRIEGLTKHYGARIIFTEDTLDLMKNPDAFHLRYLGQVKPKGKEKVLGIYECIDGDPQFDLKMANMAEFKLALQSFFRRDFVGASQILEQILRENPSDQCANYFFKKATAYMLEGVSVNWTGIQMMETK